MAGGSLVERPGRRVLPLGWAQCVALFGPHEFSEFPGAALGRRCHQTNLEGKMFVLMGFNGQVWEFANHTTSISSKNDSWFMTHTISALFTSERRRKRGSLKETKISFSPVEAWRSTPCAIWSVGPVLDHTLSSGSCAVLHCGGCFNWPRDPHRCWLPRRLATRRCEWKLSICVLKSWLEFAKSVALFACTKRV